MKKTIMFVLLLVFAVWNVAAQVRNAYQSATNNEDGVVHVDQSMRHAARPHQVIVKFQDYSDIKVNPQNCKQFQITSKSTGINAVLEGYEVANIEQLLPTFQMPKNPRRAGSFGGGEVVERDLSQLHLITLSDESPKNEYELIEELKALAEVEYAEPNYICYALGQMDSDMMRAMVPADATRVASPKDTNPQPKTDPNDPFYSQQWGIPACGINNLLSAPKLNATWRPIIAIIDTGVDIDHADLQGNIWTNSTEASGATNQDDDHNGFRDDIHGWDFVNQTGEMNDFNSHGTHCAGIAGAVTNNGIGIAGACPDALIMPVCVMQSDGTGDIATIIQGINYATQNGADIISMSLGSYAYSIALEQALAVAYQTAVIVAAAGNDTKHIDPRCCPKKEPEDGPLYPGAFTFVLGVQATSTVPDASEEHNGMLASFSNIDCDGPSFSQYNEGQLYNYELSAPGVGIMSTVPGGQYRSYNGTSMATPLVAGGIASLLQRRNYATKEVLFGDLINYSQEFHPVNFYTAYNAPAVSPAVLQCVTVEVNDSLYGDTSMYADAGERIHLYPTIRTVWGPADSIVVWLEFQEFEDTNTIHILQNHVNFVWPLSSYAHSKSLNPIDVRIDDNVVDGRKIRLNLCAYSTDATDTLRHPFTLQVTNGVKLHGMINHSDTLYPNVQYIVTQNLALPSGCTLYIKPGTTIKIKDGCSINATIQAIGKPDSMITFTKTDLGGSWKSLLGSGLFEYCIFEYSAPTGGSDIFGGLGASNCIIRNNQTGGYITGANYLIHSNIINNSINSNGRFGRSTRFNNITSNYGSTSTNGTIRWSYENHPFQSPSTYFGNNIYGNSQNNIYTFGQTILCLIADTNYYGATTETIIRKGIYDFNTPGSDTFVWIDLSKRASRPSPLAHGIVWKVEVNRFDPQDEADSVEYLGVGTHEFKVYFNRAMDTNITPIVAMGVRPPYTQKAISENASWSADSTIYTAHLTLTGRDAIDGVNRIYVSGAQDDEHFEIPVENQRFEVQVASSGSMSVGFQATPGIGKVDLEWNDQEVNYADFLGFNLYRYQYDSVLTNRHYVSGTGYVYDTVWMPVDTHLINSTLVQDTVFTDYDVVPGERYYYYYKILNTSLNENSPSKTVTCVPYGSILGDANGSFAVDVADVITTVNYVTGQNPQPFLFDAADVNGDGTINVLDIVGIINIILHPGQKVGTDTYEQQTAIYTIEDGVLHVDSPVALGGLQFSIAHCRRSDIELLDAMKGFETVYVEGEDSSLVMLSYSMSGYSIAAGKTALLRLGEKELNDIVLSDSEGHNVVALNGGGVGITDLGTLPAQIAKAYPNPFSRQVCLDVVSAVSGKPLSIAIYDITGKLVHTGVVPASSVGRYSYVWNAEGMPHGVYMATLRVGEVAAHVIKLVIK